MAAPTTSSPTTAGTTPKRLASAANDSQASRGVHGVPGGLTVYTPATAARILGVSRATVYRRCRDGRWPHSRYEPSQAIRFTDADLRHILVQRHILVHTHVSCSYDTLRGLLDEVLAHRRFTNRLDEAVILLPDNLVARIEEALGVAPQDSQPRLVD